jgi:hypothetical protein
VGNPAKERDAGQYLPNGTTNNKNIVSTFLAGIKTK